MLGLRLCRYVDARRQGPRFLESWIYYAPVVVNINMPNDPAVRRSGMVPYHNIDEVAFQSDGSIGVRGIYGDVDVF